jgi:hypothetical protein
MSHNEEMEVAVCKWSVMPDPDFCCKEMFKITPRWDKNIEVLGDVFEEYWCVTGMGLHLYCYDCLLKFCELRHLAY